MSDETTPLEILTKAREILSDPQRWIKSAFASLDEQGEKCFCLDGALLQAGGAEFIDYAEEVNKFRGWIEGDLTTVSEAENAVNYVLDLAYNGTDRGHGIFAFNDAPGTTHDEVLAVLDQAIVQVSA
jgi:hypothetical protein